MDGKSPKAGAAEKWIQSQNHHASKQKRSSSCSSNPPSSPKALSGVSEKLLYEAFNELHGLSQYMDRGLEVPAILVVGHQTDGKSALIEALMGFQFNHVGGGTKTRRPITLHLKYNAAALHPICRLLSDHNPSLEEEKTLEEIQAYIEAENMRLEQEASQFWAKEIVIKIDYRDCPNLTIIDTPGLISAAPGRKNRALQAQARAVEALVRSKMQHKEMIILCLEDCSDWSNATTRRVVTQVDPEMSRTVIVSTKLDTKIPQFGRPIDVELFLKPPRNILDMCILGGSPFFTSVPAGRVGTSIDAVYFSNEQFKEAISAQEADDIAALEEKLGRALTQEEVARIGVSNLKCFLEELLLKRYMDSVALVIPLLDKEYRLMSRKLNEITCEVSNLDEMKLKQQSRLFRDSFLAKLSLLLKGTVVAPPERFGETLEDERLNGGAFIGPDGLQIPHKSMPNSGMRLYGGAQYHRAMAEFRFIAGSTRCPTITREEIVNACGVEDIHDGTNYFRTACVIAVAKARETFEPFLHQLGFRLSHILRRLLPIALHLLQKDGEPLSGHDIFVRRVTTAFYSFAEATEHSCRERCMEDLLSTTRYVTWSLHNKNRAGLRQFLSSFASDDQALANNATVSGMMSQDLATLSNGGKQDNKTYLEMKSNQAFPGSELLGGSQIAETRLVDLLESTLWNRRLASSSEQVVNALVAQIFQGIRDHFVSSAELKFNCFFLMPVVDKFPTLLREDLEAIFEDGLDNIFDVANARISLEKRKRDLENELQRVERLIEKFRTLHYELIGSYLGSTQQLGKDFEYQIAKLSFDGRN